MIFIPSLWGIKITYFNYKVSLKFLLYTLLLFLMYLIPGLLYEGSDILRINNTYNNSSMSYFFDFCIKLIYPAFYEEFIYRGLLITGLTGIGCNRIQANIIQSILFGITHYSLYLNYGYLCILAITGQIIIGFLLGKLYYKTNSLTPCIIYHLLFDMI
jgi:membrane protease YdiL (CAAX protease family)